MQYVFYKVRCWIACCVLVPMGLAHGAGPNEHETNALPMSVSQHLALPLECKTIPTRHEQICVATTQAKLNPVNDVVFYHRDAQQQLTLLQAKHGDIALMWLHGFSTGGKYTIMGEAEEGHPSFIIYLTEAYLSNASTVKPVAVISDYFIASLESLDDNGMAEIRFLDSNGCGEPEALGCNGIIDIFKQD